MEKWSDYLTQFMMSIASFYYLGSLKLVPIGEGTNIRTYSRKKISCEIYIYIIGRGEKKKESGNRLV